MLKKLIKLIFIFGLFYQTPIYSKSTTFNDFNSRDLSNYFSGIIAYENQNNSKALKKEIEVQKLRVTGEPNGDDKLNELSSKYQSLILDVELATTLYTSSLSAYELSRVRAEKQLKHLIVASRPHLAEEALYPKRLYWILSWTIIFFILWGIY